MSNKSKEMWGWVLMTLIVLLVFVVIFRTSDKREKVLGDVSTCIEEKGTADNFKGSLQEAWEVYGDSCL